jgi:hypothetical protein
MRKRYPNLFAMTILAVSISLSWWAFRSFGNTNYFVWYLKNGSWIGMVVSFIALIWEGLGVRADLLSASPAKYVRACFGLLAAFFLSCSVYIDNLRFGPNDGDGGRRSAIASLLDSVMAPLILLTIIICVIAWLVVIAPLNYFITILTGAIARQELRGTRWRPIYKQTDKEIIMAKQPAKDILPDNAVDISLARKPFAVSQAITSLFLWIADKIFQAGGV